MSYAFSSPSAGALVPSGEGSEREVTLGVSIAVAALTTVLLPIAAESGPHVPVVVPVHAAGVFLMSMITSVLLFIRFQQSGSPALLLLGSAFLLSGLLTIAHLLAVPDLFTAGSAWIGGRHADTWLWTVRNLGFVVPVLGHVAVRALLPKRPVPPDHLGPTIATTVAVTVLVAAAAVLLTIVFDDRLPGPQQALSRQVEWVTGIAAFGALVGVWLFGRRSGPDLWLTATLVVFCFEIMPAFLVPDRYTVGWYLSRFNGLVAASLMLAMFLLETGRLHLRLGESMRRLVAAKETLEQRVRERTAELESTNAALSKALSERNLLLREVYHRVKNNLQLIDSFIALHGLHLETREQRAILDGLRQRIFALGLVHQRLMASEDLATFNVHAFLEELCRNLVETGCPAGCDIRLAVKAEPITVNLDSAIPLGLLVTELVTEALGQAFADGSSGTLTVTLSRGVGEALVLRVVDDGLPRLEAEQMPSHDPMEARIIQALVLQLDATLAVRSGPGNTVEVRLPMPRSARG